MNSSFGVSVFEWCMRRAQYIRANEQNYTGFIFEKQEESYVECQFSWYDGKENERNAKSHPS